MARRENTAAKRKKQTAPPEPVAEPERYFPSPHEGLTREQVSLRREQGLWNRPVESPSKTVGQIVRSNVFTFFNLIFFILGACVIAVGSFKNLLFLLVVAANTLIGIIQEIRAKRVLDRLTLLTAPQAAVVREGEILTVGTEELVLDDVVRFAPGNQICADAVVLEGAVQVNEALVTGEARPVTRNPGDPLLSGSFVTVGTCAARLERVGADSYAARLTVEAKKDGRRRESEHDAFLDPAGPGYSRDSGPTGIGAVLASVCSSGPPLSGGGGLHSGGIGGDDPGGAVFAHQRGAGRGRYPAGQAAHPDP